MLHSIETHQQCLLHLPYCRTIFECHVCVCVRANALAQQVIGKHEQDGSDVYVCGLHLLIQWSHGQYVYFMAAITWADAIYRLFTSSSLYSCTYRCLCPSVCVCVSVFVCIMWLRQKLVEQFNLRILTRLSLCPLPIRYGDPDSGIPKVMWCEPMMMFLSWLQLGPSVYYKIVVHI